MLNIIYFSNVTGYTQRFIEKLQWEGETHRIPVRGASELNVTEPYVLVCPSYGTDSVGHVPPQVKKFLANEQNRNFCVGVIGSGNINFGSEFARSGEVIAHKLQVPLLYKFELAGTEQDIEKVREGLEIFSDTYEENQTNQNIKKETNIKEKV